MRLLDELYERRLPDVEADCRAGAKEEPMLIPLARPLDKLALTNTDRTALKH